VTSNLLPFRSYRSLLIKFWTHCVFEPPFGGLGTTYDVHLGLIGKRVVDFGRFAFLRSPLGDLGATYDDL